MGLYGLPNGVREPDFAGTHNTFVVILSVTLFAEALERVVEFVKHWFFSEV